VLLALIGPGWEHQFKPQGCPDFVVYEIETALNLKKLVVPVLVERSSLPQETPERPLLKRLRELQAHELDLQSHFQLSAAQLIESTLNRIDVVRSMVGRIRDYGLRYLAEANRRAFREMMASMLPTLSQKVPSSAGP